MSSRIKGIYSVRLVYDPFGIQEMKQFCLSANLSQSTIGGRQGSNACTIIVALVGYHFVKLALPELTLSTLSSQWFDVLVDSMLTGNALHDLLLMEKQETSTLRMPSRAVEMTCTLLVMINQLDLTCAPVTCHLWFRHYKHELPVIKGKQLSLSLGLKV